MSKKTLVSSYARLIPVGHYLATATALLMFSLAPAILAQPADNNTWDTTVSFTGSGNLPVGNFFSPGILDDVLVPLTASMSGTGVNTANANGSGGFTVNSSFNTIVTVGGLPAVSPFSISQPHGGSDPGIPIAAPTTTVTANSAPPFYGLYPPPSGTEYTSENSVNSYARYFFATSGLVRQYLDVNFSGPMTLTLGGTPSLTLATDPSIPGDDYYSYTYDDSVLALNASVGGNDPPVDFIGNVVITTAAPAPTPETSSLAGDVLMVALFAGGVKCLRLKIEAGSPA